MTETIEVGLCFTLVPGKGISGRYIYFGGFLDCLAFLLLIVKGILDHDAESEGQNFVFMKYIFSVYLLLPDMVL